MTADGTLGFTWDAVSSLVAVKTSGALTEALQYDGLGRLVARYSVCFRWACVNPSQVVP